VTFLKTGRRAVGLDLSGPMVRAIALERRGKRLVVAGAALTAVAGDADRQEFVQAIQATLVKAGADGEPVISAIGGPEVVIRQVSLPSLPSSRILSALAMQHKDFGLLAPEDAVLDAQIVRRTKEGGATEVLAVSAPRALVTEHTRTLAQASITSAMLDVEPLALLNGAIHLTGVEPGELLVAVSIGARRTLLCLLSDHGPVVVRYLEVGAADILERLQTGFGLASDGVDAFARSLSEAAAVRAEEVCRDMIERIAEDVRLSLAFYRSEYDRESLPRFALGGWLELRQIGRWLADRLGLGTPFELMDPLQKLEVTRPPAGVESDTGGPQFLQAFGLALRGV
jgi:type IV pilus assembly protein PilM